MGWGQPCRLCHVTSGRYLAATADNQVVTFHRSAATEDATAFLVRQSKVWLHLGHATPTIVSILGTIISQLAVPVSTMPVGLPAEAS